MKTPIRTQFAALLILTSLFAQVAFAAWPSWKQEGELFVYGTITEDNKTWDVIIVPGVSNITKNAKEGFVDAGQAISEVATSGFWQRRGTEVKNGVEFSRDVITDHWFKGIGEDFTETREDNAKVVTGEIGGFFFPLVNWGWFAIKAMARTVWMPIGAAGGVTYSIVKPTLTIVWTPVVEAGFYDTAVRGLVFPTVMYVWNGFAWVGSSIGNVPTKESPFVHLVRGGSSSKKPIDLIIDKQGFEAIVQASVLRVLNEAEVARLQKRIDELEAQLKAVTAPIRNEQASIGAAQAKENSKLEAAPAEKARMELLNKAWNATNVNLSDESKDIYLDEAKLTTFVTQYLKEAGITNPAPETIQAIKKLIADNLKRMNTKMAEKGTKVNNPVQP